MNAAALLEHYGRIADAPDAVERLRRFVRDLAVRGKLIEQSERDEPAFEQLARIALAKSSANRAQRAKRIDDQSNHLANSADDLPRGWAAAPLSDLVTVLNGRAYKQHELLGSGTPVLRVGNLFTSDKWYYSDLSLDDDKYCDSGDLIYSWSASFGPFIWNGGRVIYHYHIWKLNLFSEDDLNKQFLYQVLLQKTREIKESGHGVSMIHMTKEKMERIPIWLPPLAEQHRIVAKVDELMALCDRLEAARLQREATRDRLAAASLARLNTPDPETFHADARFAIGTALPALAARPDQIKQLRQTILNLAASGRLVSQIEEGESADDLVRRAREAKRVAEAEEGIRSRPAIEPATRENIGCAVPSTWAVAAFDDLFVIVSGVTKGNKIPASEAIDAPYLRVANVQRGHLDLRVIKTIPVRASDIQRYTLRYGDVLMTEGGDWDKLGRAAVWSEEIPGCIHQNHVFRVRAPSPDILPRWITTYVNSPIGRAFFEDASKQTTNLASINMTQLRACPIPVPPRSEQHRIVAKVDELMALCDQLEASLSRGENTRSRLLDALLHEALQPLNDKVIDFAAARQGLLERRESIACRVVQRLGPTRGFGRVRAVKPLYWAEAHCGVALGGQWGRAAAGPFDQWIYSFEAHAASAGWFSVIEHGSDGKVTKAEYRALTGLQAKAEAAAIALGNAAPEFERVLSLLANLNTEDSEIVTTLYAAWNDLLLEGKAASDAAVITEVREHWHSSKARFTPARLRTWLDWLRKNHLVPKGQGPNTRHQPELI